MDLEHYRHLAEQFAERHRKFRELTNGKDRDSQVDWDAVQKARDSRSAPAVVIATMIAEELGILP